MNITHKKVDLRAPGADITKLDEESPLPLAVIPNHMGINLCNVAAVTWKERDDGQLVSLTIEFIPADDLDEAAEQAQRSVASPEQRPEACCGKPLPDPTVDQTVRYFTLSLLDLHSAAKDFFHAVSRVTRSAISSSDDEED